nr:MAG TPA: hypothetical protein [Bacteriophage sp.]
MHRILTNLQILFALCNVVYHYILQMYYIPVDKNQQKFYL